VTTSKQSRRSPTESSNEVPSSPEATSSEEATFPAEDLPSEEVLPSDGAEIVEDGTFTADEFTVDEYVTPATDVLSEEEEEEREKERARAISAAGLKAGLAGGAGLIILRLISLIPSSAFTLCLVVPGILVVCLSTGMLAGLLAGDKLETHRHAMRAGAWAGFVAGISGGIGGMVIAAFGAILLLDMGEGLVAQFSTSQLEALAQMGILPETIRLAGSVLSALLFCGVGGTATSVILSTLGGRIYSGWR
jgi:hypothetical protein